MMDPPDKRRDGRVDFCWIEQHRSMGSFQHATSSNSHSSYQWRSALVFASPHPFVGARTTEFLRFVEKKLSYDTGRNQNVLLVPWWGRPKGSTPTWNHVDPRSREQWTVGDRHNRNIYTGSYRTCLGADAFHPSKKDVEVSSDAWRGRRKPRRNWAM